MKIDMHIMASEPIRAAYFINPSHQSVSVCILVVATKWKGKTVAAARKTYATTEKLLDASSLRGPRPIKEKQAIRPSQNTLL
jgi:hypothetical protein